MISRSGNLHIVPEQRRKLTEIQVGDRVWVSGKYSGQDKIKIVKRLTPKQIVLEGQHEEYNRYHRGKPSRYDPYEPTYYGIGMSDGRIMRLATKAECEKWDAEQEQKRQRQAEAEARRKDDEALRAQLQSLLPEKASVSGPYHNTYGDWQINIYATEAEVREVAERLRGILVRPSEHDQPPAR